jgi:hypothetical protein
VFTGATFTLVHFLKHERDGAGKVFGMTVAGEQVGILLLRRRLDDGVCEPEAPCRSVADRARFISSGTTICISA